MEDAKMTDKPIVHELKANAFDLAPAGEPLESFPRDGHTVTLECSDQIPRTAFWDPSVGGIVLDDALPDGVIPLHWQEIPQA
jgi:hypothetical protein